MTLADWMLATAGLIALAILLGPLARRSRVPPSVLLALAGVGVGMVLRARGIPNPVGGEHFEEVVAFVFLPVLIFEAAFGASTRAFVRNLTAILVLAVPSLLLSAALVGVAVHAGLGVPLAAALLFGALISATDPVAVVGVFRELGVPQRLLTLVEGESLLNDGVAIVLFQILLAAALGGAVGVGEGVADFVRVFFGGVAIGAAVGVVVVALLPWLGALPATALTVAAAYGSYVVADDVLGFSGVMATAALGLVIGGFEASRAPEPIREVWHPAWEMLAWIANALLFLLIGLAIDPALLARHWEAIALALGVVLVARAGAIFPAVMALERVGHVPRVGVRNEAVLIWGGLRGGVALALALALPEQLPQHDLFVAMTGGVVLGTLLLNATTVGPLVRRLGLDRPGRADRFLAASARLSGAAAARRRLEELGIDNPEISGALDATERDARRELEAIELTPEEELKVVVQRGLSVERETYRRLTDAGMLPPSAARTLLDEVDDEIEATGIGRAAAVHRSRPLVDRLLERLSARLPQPVGTDATELAYAEASARRLAARRTGEALDLLRQLPNVSDAAVRGAHERFARWEAEAEDSLAELDRVHRRDREALYRWQAEALVRVSSEEALERLAGVGLLPARTARQAARQIAREAG